MFGPQPHHYMNRSMLFNMIDGFTGASIYDAPTTFQCEGGGGVGQMPMRCRIEEVDDEATAPLTKTIDMMPKDNQCDEKDKPDENDTTCDTNECGPLSKVYEVD